MQFPVWFPVRASMCCLAVLLLSLAAAIPSCWLSQRAAQRVSDAESRVRTQELLSPFVLELRKKSALLQPLTAGSASLPAPADLNSIIVNMQALARSAGLREAHFVPQAESVVQKNTLRLVGTVTAAPEQFRRFLLLLSDQSWITALESCSVTAGEQRTEYYLGIMTAYNPPSGGEAEQ